MCRGEKCIQLWGRTHRLHSGCGHWNILTYHGHGDGVSNNLRAHAMSHSGFSSTRMRTSCRQGPKQQRQGREREEAPEQSIFFFFFFVLFSPPYLFLTSAPSSSLQDSVLFHLSRCLDGRTCRSAPPLAGSCSRGPRGGRMLPMYTGSAQQHPRQATSAVGSPEASGAQKRSQPVLTGD